LLGGRRREDGALLMSVINTEPGVMRWIAMGPYAMSSRPRQASRPGECQRDRHGFGLFTLELCSTSELMANVT
jgi:hypothetical protein